jgi:CheY-like chemotaxis protein
MANVLIVDDTADSSEVLGKFLVRVGHEVERVPNGREALRSILNSTPDLIILDLFMPEMDGPSLLEILRSYLRLRDLPVIVLTAFPDSAVAERARRQGVLVTLQKGKASFADINQIIGDVLSASGAIEGSDAAIDRLRGRVCRTTLLEFAHHLIDRLRSFRRARLLVLRNRHMLYKLRPDREDPIRHAVTSRHLADDSLHLVRHHLASEAEREALSDRPRVVLHDADTGLRKIAYGDGREASVFQSN